MPVFTYKALDRTGSHRRGSLSADTPASGRQVLREQGLQLVEFQPARFGKHTALPSRTRRSRRQEQIADFARQLAMLLGTGVPLVEALDVLIRQQRGRILEVLRDVRGKVASGLSMSEALAEHPAWFDGVFCSAVRVGQTSGQMDAALKDLAGFMRERQTLRARLFSALAYPMILAVLGVAVVIFLMSFVVPQLLTILEDSGRPLPVATVILKSMSDALTGHWMVIVLFAAGAIAGCAGFYAWRTGRRLCHTWQLKLPLAGPLIRKSLVAQFAQKLSLLLRSGVPFLEAIGLIRGNTRQVVLNDELARMEQAVQRGSDIAPALEASRVFPPLVVHMVDVGQKSGELTEMLTQLRDGYATEVRLAIGRFAAALEPMLIVVMAALVGFVVFSTMMPILEVTRAIQ